MRALLLALGVLLPAAPFAVRAAPLAPGDLVVQGTPEGESEAGLYRVDAATGAFELLAGGAFRDHAVDPVGILFAIEDGTVVRIDPATGEKTPVPGGDDLGTLEGIAVDRGGLLWIARIEPGGKPFGTDVEILSLDPITGASAIVASGGMLSGVNAQTHPLDLEIAPDGAPLLLVTGVVQGSTGTVLRIDPDDGSAAVVGEEPFDLLALAVGLGLAPDGALVYTADGGILCDCVAVIDPVTGAITGGSLAFIVDGMYAGSAVAADIAVGADGQVWLLAWSTAFGATPAPGLFRWNVNPVVEEGGGPFLALATDALADVQAVHAICGDATVAAPEECDEGDVAPGDGCAPGCLLEACGNDRLDFGEACDDGNLVSGDGCDEDCSETACGNGIQTEGELCDDGNLESGDGCDANCTPTGCGNGVRTEGEACDDGNDVEDDGCDAMCAADFGAQTLAQRRCIAAVNAGVGDVAWTRARLNERCLAAAIRGELGADPAAFDACLAADRHEKLLRALHELARLEESQCDADELPELALGPDRLAGGPAAQVLPGDLVRDLFGAPPMAATKDDRRAARCQRKVLRQANKLHAAVWDELVAATLAKLAGRGSAPAESDAELAAHVAQAAAGSRVVGKAAARLHERTADVCRNVPALGPLFPGCEPADATALAECADRLARCRACLLLGGADPGVALDCDLFDDQLDDDTCPPAR